MEIHHDILKAVSLELTNYNYYHEDKQGAKPTRVQLKSNLAYDKFTRYLNELEDRKMIKQNPLLMTERGKDFCFRDGNKIYGFFRGGHEIEQWIWIRQKTVREIIIP